MLATAASVALTLTACSGAASSSDATDDLGTLTPGVLKIGTTSNQKPYAYTENGKLVGFEVDMARAVAKEAGLKPEFVQEDFSALLPAVANQQLDVEFASSSVTAERKKMVNFTHIYFIGYISVITNESSITDDPASLKGKKLGLLQGSIEDDYAQKNFPGATIVRFPDEPSMDQALKAHSVDALFDDAPPAQALAKANPSMSIPINIEVSDMPVAAAVSKKNPKLLAALNKAIDKVISSGKWLKIDKKYYPDQPVPKQFEPTDG